MLTRPRALEKAFLVKASLKTPFSKKIFPYIMLSGLSNQTDKIVVRFALTIYPYSLGLNILV